MNKQYNIKIPKGTVIDVDGNSFALKESIYAKSDGTNIVLTNSKIETDVLTIERRKMESNKKTNVENLNKSDEVIKHINIPNDLHNIATELLTSGKNLSRDLKHNITKYLILLFEEAIRKNAPKKIVDKSIKKENIIKINNVDKNKPMNK